ncbi:TRAP transporter substrate-binding protein [Vallitalea pronyensis]|uniref:TRAP transporter substrate-binding protein n=1 Tax=Vallitalea pronyensis TaxID=1348613 RepID=A0A8J8SH89_9FIRM|nr:TRAP transporter substrate-binding protein [Vallitalea pronyensis]QUI23620.1 TRAP transporter substrate-binding protein [Vallitalea pronyensis]
MKKVLALLVIVSVLFTGLVACSNEGTKEKTVTLKLAHNLNEQHSVHLALSEFAKSVEDKTNGEVKVQIFPNGQLGGESEVLEQLKVGAVAMTKVSAAALTTYDEGYNAFTLPYVFVDEDHYFKSMDSDAVKTLYNDTKEKGFIGLTFYNSGARSFYTVDKPILKPEDLKGVKIRVMGFQSQTDMVKALGGTPVGLPYGEVYTSLQSGVINGAESNETALTNGKHGEVAKHFSYDEHTRIPDILVLSTKVWDDLTKEQQTAVKEAASESTTSHRTLWSEAIEEAKKDAEENLGVTFHEVDKAPFREAVAPMLEKYSNDMPKVKNLLDAFKGLE